jgi:hypothetical protein
VALRRFFGKSSTIGADSKKPIIHSAAIVSKITNPYLIPYIIKHDTGVLSAVFSLIFSPNSNQANLPIFWLDCARRKWLDTPHRKIAR